MPIGNDKVFVYGTLRIGGTNSGMWGNDYCSMRRYAKGRLHYVQGNGPGPYPVFVPSDDDEWVVGDLFFTDLWSPEFHSIMAMEAQAGYDMRWGHVYVDPSEDAKAAEALMFVWPWADKGAHIASGDWLRRGLDEPFTSPRLHHAHCDGCDRYVTRTAPIAGYNLCELCHPDGEDMDSR